MKNIFEEDAIKLQLRIFKLQFIIVFWIIGLQFYLRMDMLSVFALFNVTNQLIK